MRSPVEVTSSVDMCEPIGDWSEEKTADAEIVELCNRVRADLEGRSGRDFMEFSVVAYRELFLLSGTQYVVKINVGQGECLFLTIFHMFLHGGNRTLTLAKYEEGKKSTDPILVPDVDHE